MCCIPGTRIQDTSFATRLDSLSNSSVKLHLRHSGDYEDTASVVAGFDMALNERSNSALPDWILVNNWLFVGRLRGSYK